MDFRLCAIQHQYPDWWIRGSGAPYPMGCTEHLTNELDGICSNPSTSVLVVRDQQHKKNLSGGKEVLVPSRLLYGLIPDALLDAYTFWQVCGSRTFHVVCVVRIGEKTSPCLIFRYAHICSPG